MTSTRVTAVFLDFLDSYDRYRKREVYIFFGVGSPDIFERFWRPIRHILVYTCGYVRFYRDPWLIASNAPRAVFVLVYGLWFVVHEFVHQLKKARRRNLTGLVETTVPTGQTILWALLLLLLYIYFFSGIASYQG